MNLLLECNIPHNVVILKGKPFDHSQFHSQVIKTILIPRKPEYGIIAPSSPLPVCYSTPTSAGEKGSGAMTAQLPPTFSAAACELAQGFIPVLGITTLISITKYSSIIYPVRSIIWYKVIDYRVDLRSLASVPHHLPTPALTMPRKFSCILINDSCRRVPVSNTNRRGNPTNLARENADKRSVSIAQRQSKVVTEFKFHSIIPCQFFILS